MITQATEKSETLNSSWVPCPRLGVGMLDTNMPTQGRRHGTRGFAGCLLFSLCCVFSGCETLRDIDMPWDKVELPPPPKEVSVYRGGHWEQEQVAPAGTLAGDFASAKLLFEGEDYANAERVFRKLARKAEKEKNPDLHEDCLFMEAESLYRQQKYRAAQTNYQKLLENYPSSKHRTEAVQRQYAIADYWLDDTRQEMEEWKEHEEGKRSVVWPRLLNFEKSKPLIDVEGHATKACEAVYMQDPAGPLAPQALFRAGGVNYFRENYEEADERFSLLVDQYPKSTLAPKALELAIQAKTQATGGPQYDSRKLAEARRLVDTALRGYPELKEKEEFLQRTLFSINEQQAEKEYRIADFYHRTGHPASAYFYYELVRRRYKGTDWATKATEKMNELRSQVEKELAEPQGTPENP